MLTATKVGCDGVKDGKLILQFLGTDQKRYDMALTPLAATQAVISILQKANDLPKAEGPTVEGAIVQGGVTLAIGDKMQPLLALTLGGLELALPLSDMALTVLRDGISQYLGQMKNAQ